MYVSGYDPTAGLISVLAFYLLLIVLILVVASLFYRKSKEYRKTMADMYVVGKIKQLAEKDGIDLIKELKEFAKAMKYKKIDVEELDKTIERELQEKIAREADDKIEGSSEYLDLNKSKPKK